MMAGGAGKMVPRGVEPPAERSQLPRRRPIVFLATAVGVLVLALMGSSGAASEKVGAAGSGPTILYGTNAADTLTAGEETIWVFGRGGDDELSDPGGALLLPGSGRDLARGSQAWDQDGNRRDVLRGTDEADFLVSADGSRDTVRCGANPEDPNPFQMKDIAIVDGSDVLSDCEVQYFASTGGVFLPNGIGGPYAFVFGSNAAETLEPQSDDPTYVFGKGGDDLLRTSADGRSILFPGSGSDIVTGGAAGDFIIDDDGGRWTDRLQGEGGNDIIISADGRRDVLKCGSGGETSGDSAIADEGDIVRGCEVVERG